MRRISVETDCRKEKADLIAAFSSPPCPEMAPNFEWENVSDSAGNEEDLSLLGLE